MKGRSIFAVLVLAILPAQAFAWGSTGHTMVSRLAAHNLPASVPAFLRTPAAVEEIAALGPEEDRIKGAGSSWDRDNDEAHFLDLDDDGSIAGAVRLNALPSNMPAYAEALAKVQTTPYKQGYLPYAIADGYERVRKDFAYWRVDDYLASHATTVAARASFTAQRALRQDLTLRDIGDWGHFVADGSQPLHVSIHYNGWGDYPNPNNFTTKHIHSFFESAFVDRYSQIEDVQRLMKPYTPEMPSAALSQEQIAAVVGTYLEGTAAEVTPLYRLYSAGAFESGSSQAVRFTDAQLARGAEMFRDLVALAWEDSIDQSVGYPEIPVREVLTGKTVPRI